MRSKTRKQRKQRKQRMKGGFVPSIMEGFCSAASKYIVPVTLFIMHRMMQDSTGATTRKKKGSRRK